MSNEKQTVKLNDDQIIAVGRPYNENTIVTAAAGSGKTTLLVERIVQLLSDIKLGIKADETAIMTFTRNATKSLREKVSRALKKKLEEYPGGSDEYEYISEQILLLRQAYISTIDSFCLRLIRENPEAFELPLNFSMASEMKKITMRLQAADLAMKDFYNEETQTDNDDNDEAVRKNLFTDDKRRALFYTFNFENDNDLRESLMSVEDTLSTYPDADSWLNGIIAVYQSPQSCADRFLGAVINWLEDCSEKADRLFKEYDEILSVFENEAAGKFKEKEKAMRLEEFRGGPLKNMNDYIGKDRCRYEKYKSDLNKLKRAPTLNDTNNLIKEFRDNADIGSPGSFKGCPNGVESRKRFTVVKDKLNDLAESISKLDLSNELDPNRFAELRTAVNAFIKLLRLYTKYYTDIKKSSGNLDFSDCELLLLKKLSDESFREQIAGKFKCVIVDEFQDSNDIQAEIFKLIGGNNLFYVGDVKQSIYAFRGGNPKIMAALCGGADNFTRVPLNMNYRSREAVIDTVNAAFSQLMTGEYGGVDYYDADPKLTNELIPGATLPKLSDENKKKYFSEIIFVSGDNTSEKEMNQPRAVARKIKELHDDESFKISKNDKLVRPDYSDFSILMRASSKMPYYQLALAELGISAASPGGRKFLETEEIALILDYLTIVDNPQRNEEALRILMSPLYRLDAEEMSLIRLGLLGIDAGALNDEERNAVINSLKNHSLYSCARICARSEYKIPGTEKKIVRTENSKLKAFFDDITKFRYFMCTNSVYRLVCKICEDTDLLSTVAAFSDSEQRIANVRQFQDMSAEYESRDGGSLSDFLRYIEYAKSLKDNKVDEAKRPDSPESVKLMTFHASKGLEFPVCIMCELESPMSEKDIRGSLILDRSDLAVRSVDSQKRVKTENLAFFAIKNAIKKELIGEELRLMYVAMTRAQDKLIMFAEMKPATQEKWKSTPLDPENLPEVFENNVPFRWIFDSLIRNYDRDSDQFSPMIKCSLSSVTAPGKPAPHTDVREFADITEDEVKALADKIGYKYKYQSDTERRAKFSVTEIAHMNSENVNVRCIEPDFVKKGVLTGPEVGTAYHKCMEMIPLDELKTASQGQYAGIVSSALSKTNKLSEDEKRVINPEKIVKFLTSELGQGMLKSSKVYRERRFFEQIDGKEIGHAELGVFKLQGIVDMFYIENNEIIMVDYKTDTIENFKKDLDAYKNQVKMYRTVLLSQTGLPVKKVYLYTFHNNEALEITVT